MVPLAGVAARARTEKASANPSAAAKPNPTGRPRLKESLVPVQRLCTCRIQLLSSLHAVTQHSGSSSAVEVVCGSEDRCSSPPLRRHRGKSRAEAGLGGAFTAFSTYV